MVYLQDRVSLQQVNDEEQQAWDILKEAGYVGMIGKNTFSRTPGVLFLPLLSLLSPHFSIPLLMSFIVFWLL